MTIKLTAMRPSTAFLAAFAASVATLSWSASAEASCSAGGLANGEFYNVDAATRGVTRIELRRVCNTVSVNGSPTFAGYALQMWGACSPTDCKFPTVMLRKSKRRTGVYFGSIDQGYAKRHVTVYPYGSSQFGVTMRTDFKAASRRDYTSTARFEPRG